MLRREAGLTPVAAQQVPWIRKLQWPALGNVAIDINGRFDAEDEVDVQRAAAAQPLLAIRVGVPFERQFAARAFEQDTRWKEEMRQREENEAAP